MIYLVGTIDERGEYGKYVKIGYCMGDNLKERISSLQIGNPDELVCFGVLRGGMEQEKELHEKFKKLHYRGEWFHRYRRASGGGADFRRRALEERILYHHDGAPNPDTVWTALSAT